MVLAKDEVFLSNSEMCWEEDVLTELAEDGVEFGRRGGRKCRDDACSCQRLLCAKTVSCIVYPLAVSRSMRTTDFEALPCAAGADTPARFPVL